MTTLDIAPNRLRAEALECKRNSFPQIGRGRSQDFGASLRAETMIWNDSERIRVQGYASIVGRAYKMYDMFGEYEEIISPGAFDETLSRNPDVAFLLNHRGVTMARTTNGSLELEADSKGLKSTAYLNPKRTDVRDLVTAIEDKDVTEMSFAFMIDEGEWDEDYTRYEIGKVNIDRGDVSAVNYGANPYTSIQARQQEIIYGFTKIPTAAQDAALRAAGLPFRLNGFVKPEDGGSDSGNRGGSDSSNRGGSDTGGGDLSTQDTRSVDNQFTDPHTLWVEQWLTCKSLVR